MIKIVVLVKTFRGEEFLEPMVISVAPFVDKIVFVNSEISWTGRRGNTCKPVIEKLKREFKDKIISLDYNINSQKEQVDYGFNYIRKHIPYDFLLLQDTDEVWNYEDLNKAIQYIQDTPQYSVFRVQMYTYIKSPFWRVWPIEKLKPIVFVSNKISTLGESSRAHDYHKEAHKLPPDIHLHHFIYVRKDFNTVLEKIISSHSSENTEYMDMSKWIPNVYNKMPNVKNFHPSKGFEHFWQELIIVQKTMLPRVFSEREFDIIKRFE